MPVTEAVVAQVDDLKEGEMRQVTVGETDVLLARSEGAYHALYGHCTHYGAPLAEGVLSDGRVVCPWHHACFRVADGDHLEPPGLDALPRFEVHVEGEDVVVRVPEDFDEHRLMPMARRDAGDDRVLAVLGAGAAGAYAAEAARQEGFTGRVVLITREADPPYDRPNLSKDYLSGEAPEEWMPLRPSGFYEAHDIELMLRRTVTEVDALERTLTFADGEMMRYDTLVLCTGGTPRTLRVPGADLGGVFMLRSFADSRCLRVAAREARSVVVVGASFIGMECAASLRELNGDLDATVVAPEAVPFEQTFGERAGRRVQQMHEAHGVRFALEQEVEAFEGQGEVERVVLRDGTTLDADLVVVGIGVRPATDFVNGLETADGGGVVVDEYLRATLSGGTADGSCYAAGDIARFPDWCTGTPVRIEHWRLACQHGRLAGRNAAGGDAAYRSVPFFWTAHYGQSFRYVGHAEAWDEVIYDGDPDDAFIAYYVEDGQVRAALGLGRDRAMDAVEELMRRDLMPPPATLRDGAVDLAKYLHAAV